MNDLTSEVWIKLTGTSHLEIAMRQPDHIEVVAHGRYMIYLLKNGDTITLFDADGDPNQPKPVVGFTTSTA